MCLLSGLHLDMLVAKDKDTMVSCCGHCVNKIVDKICILLDYPENIDRVCNRFLSCYANVWCFKRELGNWVHVQGNKLSSIFTRKYIQCPQSKSFLFNVLFYYVSEAIFHALSL